MMQNSKNTKPTLVLLHGWGLNHAIWQPIAAQLANECDVIALDLPGYGNAVDSPEPYTLDALADQLAQAIPRAKFVVGVVARRTRRNANRTAAS